MDRVAETDRAALEFALITLQAGRTVMDIYAADPRARLKADRSPVTDADEQSEALIMEALARAFPGVPMLAEEACARQGLPSLAPAEAILVDPLDGTREFIARNGEFTINIGLVRDGKPIAGAVYAPALGRLWWGGTRAYSARVAPGSALPGRELHEPAHCRPAATPLHVLESRSHASPELATALARLGRWDATLMGSSVKFCLIASGEADLCLRPGPTMEWDTAAGDAVLRAAGGITLGLDGAPLHYGKAAEGFRNTGFVAWGDPAAARPLLDGAKA